MANVKFSAKVEWNDRWVRFDQVKPCSKTVCSSARDRSLMANAKFSAKDVMIPAKRVVFQKVNGAPTAMLF